MQLNISGHQDAIDKIPGMDNIPGMDQIAGVGQLPGMGQDVGKGWDSKDPSGKEALPDAGDTSSTGLLPLLRTSVRQPGCTLQICAPGAGMLPLL